MDFGLIPASIFQANVPKCKECCSTSSLSEFIAGSSGSTGDGLRPAVQIPRFFTSPYLCPTDPMTTFSQLTG